MKILILFVTTFSLGFGGLAMATETPDYKVVLKSDDFETRRYPPVLIAETVVDGDFDSASSAGFKRLAGYIFGGNISEQKIAMTAPVGQMSKDRKFVISFTMPRSYTLESLPIPKDKNVTLKLVPEKTYAAICFSGTWSQSRYQAHLQSLRTWIEQQHFTALGEPTFARYDPPWTPWFMRRNEILIEIQN